VCIGDGCRLGCVDRNDGTKPVLLDFTLKVRYAVLFRGGFPGRATWGFDDHNLNWDRGW
jgi:hypothetical protein